MSSSPFEQAGQRPSATSYELLAYRHRLLALAYAPLLEANKARSTTYYVDSAAGSDANAGTSTGAPVQTLSKVHDLIQASSGDVRVRFKYGSEFVGSGANYEWSTNDHSHRAAVYCRKDNITLDCYGDPRDGKVVFRISAGLGSSWTDATGGAYYASGWTSTVDMVYETDGSTATFTRQTSLANCQANARSMYYDAGNDRVYVNYNDADSPPSDLYAIEANYVTCLRIRGDDIICDMDGADFYGFGLHNSDQNSHDYAVGALVESGDLITVANVNAYYGSAHLVATWHQSAGEDGCICWLNIAGAHGYAGRVINVYQPSGGMSAVLHNVRSEDTIAQAADGHTASGTLGDIWADSCYGGVRIADIDATKSTVFGCHQGSHDTPVTGNSIRMPNSGDCINSTFWCQTTGEGTTLSSSAKFYNCHLDFISTFSGDSFVAKGIFSSAVDASSIDIEAYHTTFRLFNPSGGSRRGVGLSYDAVQNTGEDTDGVATRCCWINSGPYNSTYPVHPGIGNSDIEQVNCSYRNCKVTGSRDQAGYDNVTTAAEISNDTIEVHRGQVVFVAGPQQVRSIAPSVEYDIHGQRRRSDTSTDGPVELLPSSSIATSIASRTFALTYSLSG